MKKPSARETRFVPSCGNVFADLGLPDAEELKVKSDLSILIMKIAKARAFTQQEVSNITGLSQPRLSGLMRGRFTGVSERRLMDALASLGQVVRIVVEPARKGYSGSVGVEAVQRVAKPARRSYAGSARVSSTGVSVSA